MNTETLFRLLTVTALILVFGVSSYFRYRAERQGGPMQTPQGRGFVVVMRLLGLLFLLPLFGYLINPDWVAWARLTLPDWVRWIAALLIVAIVPAVWWIFTSLGTNISPTQATRVGHQLITHGPYRWVRHPLYTVGFIFYLALSVLTGLWTLGLGILILGPALIWRTPQEEANLIETFGDEYREYMQRTGRFLPHMS